jgi:hypothetical protein
MGYEDQLRQAERIIDKINAGRQPDGEVMKRLKDLEETVAVFVALCLIEGVVLAILVIAHLVH